MGVTVLSITPNSVPFDCDPSAIEVRQIMTEHVVSCTLSMPIHQARRIMAARGIRHLPIIEHGTPMGMVSSRDVLAFELHEATTKLANAGIVGPEIVSPLTDAMGLIHGQQLDSAPTGCFEKTLAAKTLWRHIHQVVSARDHPIEPLSLLRRT